LGHVVRDIYIILKGGCQVTRVIPTPSYLPQISPKEYLGEKAKPEGVGGEGEAKGGRIFDIKSFHAS
jgi:hypothetical protein